MYETKESKTVSAWVTESDLVIGFGLGYNLRPHMEKWLWGKKK